MDFDVGSWLQYILCSQFIIGFIFWLYSRKYAHLPGEFGFPIFGNLYNIIYSLIFSSPPALIDRIDKVLEKHGNLSCFWVGPFLFIVLADPSLVEELAYHPAAVNKESMVYDKVNILAKGAFTRSHSDAQWKEYRKVVNNALRKHRLETYHDVFVRRSTDLVDALGSQNGEFDIKPIILLSCLDMAVESQLGLAQISELMEKNFGLSNDIMMLSHAMGQAFANPLFNILSWIFLRYYYRKALHFQRFTDKCFAELMKNYENYKNVEDDELPIAAVRIKHNMEHRIPHKETKLELHELVFVNSHTVGEVLSGLQVIKEACRLLAAPIFARMFTEEAKIGNYKIPKNSTVLIGSMRMRTDPKYWENPTKFDPDHFLPEKILSRHKFANVAFGVLPRHCPGGSYVMNISKVIISAVVRKFKLSSSLKPEELRFIPEVLMVLDGPYSIRCERRLPQES